MQARNGLLFFSQTSSYLVIYKHPLSLCVKIHNQIIFFTQPENTSRKAGRGPAFLRNFLNHIKIQFHLSKVPHNFNIFLSMIRNIAAFSVSRHKIHRGTGIADGKDNRFFIKLNMLQMAFADKTDSPSDGG